MPAFWLFVVVIGLGVLYALLFHIVAFLTSPAGWVLSLLLMLLFIVPVALVLRWLDSYEREPRSMVIGAFLWGALVVPLFAGLATTRGAWSSRASSVASSPTTGARP